MSDKSFELPFPVPPDVAQLGEPERLFTPGKGDAPPPINLLIAVGVGALGLVLWAAAANMTGLLLLPEQPEPDSEIGLYLGVPCMVLGTVFVLIAAWYGLGGGVCKQSYLLYPDVLVELFPDRHRIIGWDKIGPPHRVQTLAPHYEFPVSGDKPLSFNYSMQAHAQLFAALTRHKMLFQIGGEDAYEALPSQTPARHFLAVRPSWGDNDIYRVSIVGKNLLFLHVGTGDTKPVVLGPAQMGLAGAIGAYTRNVKYNEFRKNMDDVDGADEQALFHAATNNGKSFLIPVEHLRHWTIDYLSTWQKLFSSDTGYVEFNRKDGDTLTLHFPTNDNLSDARRELANVRELKGDPVLKYR